jgi:predicted cupin superfamily sugar epimerase
MLTAAEVIEALELQPHPIEGGHFRETYRSVAPVGTPAGARSLATAIYYLLTPDTFSEMHRLPGDEIFHFYLGDPVRMLQLWPDGTHRLVGLGTDLAAGQRPQVVVPGGVWQGSLLEPGGRFALLGATMAPGFDYADYETGDRARLVAEYPTAAEWIARLTRG